MKTPSKDADVHEWRQYAGWLRGRLGDVNRHAAVLAEEIARPLREEMRAQKRASDAMLARISAREMHARERAQRLARHRNAMQKERVRDRDLLDRVEALLFEGDAPAAIDELMVRRAAIDAARARREAEQ